MNYRWEWQPPPSPGKAPMVKERKTARVPKRTRRRRRQCPGPAGEAAWRHSHLGKRFVQLMETPDD